MSWYSFFVTADAAALSRKSCRASPGRPDFFVTVRSYRRARSKRLARHERLRVLALEPLPVLKPRRLVALWLKVCEQRAA